LEHNGKLEKQETCWKLPPYTFISLPAVKYWGSF